LQFLFIIWNIFDTKFPCSEAGCVRSCGVDIGPSRKSPAAILLRESVREGKLVRKRTITNLWGLPLPISQAEMIWRALKDEQLG
jgi:hypothetical protein